MFAPPIKKPQPKAFVKAAASPRAPVRPARPLNRWDSNARSPQQIALLMRGAIQRKRASGAGTAAPEHGDRNRADERADRNRPVPLKDFPHGDAIGRGLGQPIPTRAVVDPAGCAGQGAPAFTRDGQAHFASPSPTLRVAAHEAAHVLQQRGATRDMGLGAEGHAAAIEHRISRGTDAAPLLGDLGAAVDGSERRYTEVPQAAQTPKKWPAGMDLRVSDDGNMAVRDGGLGSHFFWAAASKVLASNATLKAVGSAVRLELQSDSLAGTKPGSGAARALTKVLPNNAINKTGGESMTLWDDCGMAGRDVMGAGAGTGENYEKMTARYKLSVKPAGAKAAKIVTKDTVAYGPSRMKEEIFKKKFAMADGAAALAHYQALPATDRDRIDKELGINQFATPGTGQGYTISSGGEDFPGKEDDTWNFHWGGVVMVSGSDRVTLENYAMGGPVAVQNTDWKFQMYGPASKPGQTFHEQHLDTELHGQAPTTMAVHKR